MARGCWAPAASAEAGGTGMCSALQGSALVRGEQLFAPPLSPVEGRALHPSLCCLPRSSIPLRCTATGFLRFPRGMLGIAEVGGGGCRHPAPTMSQVSGVVPPPKKNHYLLIPVCSVVVSPLLGHPAGRRCHLGPGLGDIGMGTRSEMHHRPRPSITGGRSPGWGLLRDPHAREGPPRHGAVLCTSAPAAPPGQAGLHRTTDALHLPLLFGPVEAVFEGQRGRSAAESGQEPTSPRALGGPRGSPVAGRSGRDPRAGGRVSLLYFFN